MVNCMKSIYAEVDATKATLNKFPVSRPLLKYIFTWAGSPFPVRCYYLNRLEAI